MAGNNRYLLVVRRGPKQGHSFPLNSALASLGRYAGNTIVIPDETVSRHHARLRQTADGYTIEDLNSANGLYVNDSRVTDPRALSSGDLIRLGEVVELVYEVVTQAEEQMQVAAATGAFDDKPGLARPVSDTGGTVWMKKVVSTVGRDEEAPRGGGSRTWLWIAILAGVVVLGAIAYFALVAGH